MGSKLSSLGEVIFALHQFGYECIISPATEEQKRYGIFSVLKTDLQFCFHRKQSADGTTRKLIAPHSFPGAILTSAHLFAFDKHAQFVGVFDGPTYFPREFEDVFADD